MASYAPPSIDYFSGLQFNPNLYENPLIQGISKLYGAAVSIIGTISTIITTPLFKVIQGATTTIETTELSTILRSTSYTDIISPNINLAPLGTWAGVSAAVGYSQLYNPTQVLIFSNFFQVNTPLMEVNPASYGSSNGTINFNTYPADPSVVNSSIYITGGTATPLSGDIVVSANYTAFKNRYVLFDPASRASNQIDLNFYTNPSNAGVVCSAISCTGGTALPLDGTMDFNVRTMNNNAVIHNINSSTLSVGLNGGTISVPAALTVQTTGEIRFTTTGGTYPLYTDAPILGITTTTGGGTITAAAWNGIQYNSIYYFSTTTTGTWSYVLPTTIRPGNRCRVMNLGTGNVNLSVAGGSARMFGPGLLRTGNVSYTIGPLQGASIECVNGAGIVAIGGSVYFIGPF